MLKYCSRDEKHEEREERREHRARRPEKDLQKERKCKLREKEGETQNTVRVKG